MVKYFEKIWLVTQSWFGSGNLCGVNKSCKIVIQMLWKSIAAAWHKLMHKQWRAVGVVLTFYSYHVSYEWPAWFYEVHPPRQEIWVMCIACMTLRICISMDFTCLPWTILVGSCLAFQTYNLSKTSVTDWVTDWLSDWLTDWLSDMPNSREASASKNSNT